MPHKLISATGYLTGDATTPTKGKIRGILVIPGTAGAGSFKIESGAAGVNTDLIPDSNATIPVPQVTKEGEHAYYYPLTRGLLSLAQIYVTVTNCKLLIEYD